MRGFSKQIKESVRLGGNSTSVHKVRDKYSCYLVSVCSRFSWDEFDIAENYYYLASVYKLADNLGNAEKYFKMAIEKDQNYIEAKRELRLIQSRKVKGTAKKSSSKKIEKKFWSGLFKK